MSVRTLIVAASVSITTLAHAQTDPTFKYGEKEEVKEVEWTAAAQLGFTSTTGNSKTTALTAGANASRKAGNNKFSAEGTVAYARSSIFLAVDGNGDGVIEESEISRPATTTTQAWLLKARYDRFLTEHNSLYVTGVVSGDEPAGKEFVGGGQLGYSRMLLEKKDAYEVVLEAGYDFSYEDLVVGDGVAIHSGRAFAGYTGKLSDETSALASAEVLLNVNTLDTPTGEVGPFEDARINAKLEVNTKLFGDLSAGFSFAAKYDHAPAPRPPFDLPYAPGFVFEADKLDTITKVSLIYNFL